MTATAIVFLGAGLGGAMRHGVNLGCARLCGTAFPWGTVAINVSGSLAMGLLIGWLAFRAEGAWSESARLFGATGVLGGFTTFSAFSLDAVLLWERGQVGAALAYGAGSVALSIAALVGGLATARAFG